MSNQTKDGYDDCLHLTQKGIKRICSTCGRTLTPQVYAERLQKPVLAVPARSVNQTKDTIEEILSGFHDPGDDMRPRCKALVGNNTMSDCDCGVQEALAAINKEIERIGLELVGKDYECKPSYEPEVRYAIQMVNKEKVFQRTRLTQALKGREGESDADS